MLQCMFMIGGLVRYLERVRRELASMNRVLQIGIVALLSSCSASDRTNILSLVEAISDPEDYVGERVIVVGYLSRSALYLTEEHANVKDQASSLILNYENALLFDGDGVIYSSVCENRFAVITGTLDLVYLSENLKVLGINIEQIADTNGEICLE